MLKQNAIKAFPVQIDKILFWLIIILNKINQPFKFLFNGFSLYLTKNIEQYLTS